MINLKTIVASFTKPTAAIRNLQLLETNTVNSNISKTNSLAYLSYKNRKQRGLISSESSDCPTILFGDEWVF